MKIGVVMGAAEELHGDLETLYEFTTVYADSFARVEMPVVRIAVNAAGFLYGGALHHWVTLHWEKFSFWQERRRARCEIVGDNYETWTRQESVDAHIHLMHDDHHLPHHALDDWGSQPGGSGLFAVHVALNHLGAERVVLCGMPLTPTAYAAGSLDDWGGAWPEREVEIHREGWREWHLNGSLRGVRSMSGWTRDLLGAPDGAFFNEGG